ncbi:MAG: tyrosyl-tRNA synthetase [Watsoniomyces obsoletus]|nr:MAG: tyrosyl-tRNA synthetase [Watsoniomyces obsoletus]
MYALETIVCRQCIRRISLSFKTRAPALRRGITQNFLRKTAEAEEQWKLQAEKIRKGEKKSMLTILEERGYVDAIAGKRESLDKLMTDHRVGAYVGIDPTAPSIHLGNLLPLMALFWLYVHGFHTVSLLGGMTVKIGDPIGRLTQRATKESHQRKADMTNMHYQLKLLWKNVELHARKHGYEWEWAWKRELANNNAWLNKLTVNDFLNLLGSGVRLGTMLSRETVQRRLHDGEGMSFSEFCYPLLQAWDWWYMFDTKGIQLQIGGSDQFGNIVAGIEVVKHIAKNHPDPVVVEKHQQNPEALPHGFTVPLLTTSAGEKFGKSAGNAVWLSEEMTSVFDLYQFFLRSADEDVERYLKLFTFLPLPSIAAIMAEHSQNPHLRKAHHILAREVVALVHGELKAREAELQHRSIFRRPGKTTANSSQELEPEREPNLDKMALGPPSNLALPASLVYGQSPPRLLCSAGLVQSRSEGFKLIGNNGAYIGSRPDGKNMENQTDFVPLKNWTPQTTKDYLIDGKLLILRAGKWKVKIINVVSDEEFETLGLDAPGWAEKKQEMAQQAAGVKMKPETVTNPEPFRRIGPIRV